ncbi:MAG: serine/threonine protein kinase [Planctomycetaceae bacterium]|nr:serine/threonine protein kinase [Planctomycetaceae bacterium]
MTEPETTLVDDLAEEFAERLRGGDSPSISEYVDSHPDHADELRDALSSIVMIEQLAKRREQDRQLRRSRPKRSFADPERLGDYRIIRRIGHGGMGIVYEAVHESLDRRVALKLLPPHLSESPRHVERFTREVRAAARLHHTNIVPVFGVGQQDDAHFYVMQLINGRGLDEIIREQSDADDVALQPDRFRRVAEVGVCVSGALACAHESGVLHRDVKPANILLEVDHVWVTDFGLARLLDEESLTATGDVVGTLRYSAPESFERENESDARSDIYSLGLTLYEFASLKPAFTESSRAKLLRQITNDSPPAIRTTVPGLPADLGLIIEKAISREPQHRYQTAAELAADLQRFLEDRPILARRVSQAERLRRWCRRNPIVAGLSAATATLLIAVTLLSTFGYFHLRTAYEQVGEALGQARQSATNATNAAAQARLERDRAREESDRAEQNLLTALRAFEKIADQIGSRELPQSIRISSDVTAPVALSGGLAEADAELLQSLLGFYDEFAIRNDQSRSWDIDTARVHYRIGDIHYRLARNDEAVRAWKRCLEVLDNASRSNNELAASLLAIKAGNAIGRVHLLSGRFDQASTSFRESLTRLDTLSAGDRSSPSARLARGVTLTQIINAWSAEHHYEQTRRGPRRRGTENSNTPPEGLLADFEQARDTLTQLTEAQPDNQDGALALARCYSSILTYAWAIDDPQLAVTAKQKAVAILRRLQSGSPTEPDVSLHLADALAITPEAVTKPLSMQDAADLYESEVMASRLHERFPTSLPYHLLLASTRHKLGAHYSFTENTAQAEASLTAAVDDWQSLSSTSPGNAMFEVAHARTRWILADLLRRQDRPDEAIQQLETALRDLEDFIARNGRAGVSNGLLVGLYRRVASLHEYRGNTKLAAEFLSKADSKKKSP